MQAIADSYETLPPVLKKVADYITENTKDVPFLTIKDLCKIIDVNPSTFVRFAKVIGFSGFKEMQNILRTHHLSTIQSYQQRVDILKDNITTENITPLQNAYVKTVSQADAIINTIDQSHVDSFARDLLACPTIYLYARGRSEMLAVYFRYIMLRLGYNVTILPVDVELAKLYLQSANGDDALFAISFKDYSEQTKQVFNTGRDKKLNLFSITDFVTSPIAQNNNRCLFFENKNRDFPHTQVGTVMLIDSILQTIAVKK